MGVYATIKVTERSKGGFSRLMMDHYMIDLENTTTFLDYFKSVAHAAALGSLSFSHELRPTSPKDEVQCYISTTTKIDDRIRVSPTLNIKASLESVLGRDSKKDSERKFYLAKEKPDVSCPWTVNFSCFINKTINYSSKSSLLTLKTVFCTSSDYQLSTENNIESILRLFDFLFSSLPPRIWC